MITPENTLQRLVDEASELFTLPAVAVEVLQLTDDPRVDARRLKRAIENDPALTTKVLRVVNSSLFGLSREIGDLNQALALLGVKPLKLLVLGFSLPGELFANVAGDVLSRYWQTALTKAVAAREISHRFWHSTGDDAFVAGLLDDLGMLVLIQKLSTYYVTFLERVHNENADLRDLERAALGFDHSDLTIGLLRHWGLPGGLVSAIGAPTDDIASPAAPGGTELTRVLHMARLTTALLVDKQLDALTELLETGRRFRGLPDDEIQKLIQDLQTKVEQLASVLSLTLPSSLNYAEVLERSRSQLAKEATQAVIDLLSRRRSGLAAARRDILAGGEANRLTTAVAHWASEAHSIVARPGPARSVELEALPAIATAGGTLTADAAADSPLEATSTLVASSVSDDDPALVGRLNVCIAACRQARRPLTLLLVEVDKYREAIATAGSDALSQAARLVEHACRVLDHPNATLTEVREARFAIILPDCDRREAVEHGNRLVRQVRELTSRAARGGAPGVTISVGAASVANLPKNFPAQDLLDSADRCLYAAQTAGGNTLKSIEIY